MSYNETFYEDQNSKNNICKSYRRFYNNLDISLIDLLFVANKYRFKPRLRIKLERWTDVVHSLLSL
jgi:hypothetical protein